MEIYRNVPKLSTIEKIANALHVEPLELFRVPESRQDEDDDEERQHLEQIKRLKDDILATLDPILDRILQAYIPRRS
jgi:transcriptional regulator with XRE-family HTH domain